jgi:hypothetical protein
VQLSWESSAVSKRSLPTASRQSHRRSISENAAELGWFVLETPSEPPVRLRGIIAEQRLFIRQLQEFWRRRAPALELDDA